MDLLLAELSLDKSTLMGARVAPFSPVGYPTKNEVRRNSAETLKTHKARA